MEDKVVWNWLGSSAITEADWFKGNVARALNGTFVYLFEAENVNIRNLYYSQGMNNLARVINFLQNFFFNSSPFIVQTR